MAFPGWKTTETTTFLLAWSLCSSAALSAAAMTALFGCWLTVFPSKAPAEIVIFPESFRFLFHDGSNLLAGADCV
jgi:CHASE2 domain-containing sensor protein